MSTSIKKPNKIRKDYLQWIHVTKIKLLMERHDFGFVKISLNKNENK